RRCGTSRRPTSCRAGTNRCQTGTDLNCKKCRLGWIERLIKLKYDRELPRDYISPQSHHDNPLAASLPSVSESKDSFHIMASSRSLLERLGVHYRAMCHTRMMSELHARGDAPHPLHMSVDNPPVVPTTYKIMHCGHQILLGSALEFGNVAFPEFAGFNEHEKWDIVTEFFYRFRVFEGCYRANERFPENHDRILLNFTSYLAPEVYATFHEQIPEDADIEGARNYMKDGNLSIKEVATAREIIARLNPHHEEFFAVIGLMFWTIDGISVRQDITTLAEKYTKQIMSELHSYYREILKIDDYAARLGELLSFLQVFDVKERYKEHLETLRLFNVLKDDSFVYRLQKD
ncbi:hypothetical protein PENTCL1PPCAC_16940, partial [Pristionchus entomophagus]